MKKIQILSLFTIALLFSSCEDVIQVKLDKGNPLLTIDAFVNDLRTQQKVRITYSDDYFSQKPSEPALGAVVWIKDITANKTFTFTSIGNGDYVYNLAATDTIGKVNHNYELTVVHQGDVFTSKSTMYRTAPIDSVDVKYIDAGPFGGKAGYRFSFLGFDPEGPISDYYWIKSYRNGVFFNKGGEINLACNGAYSAEADGLFFIPPIAEGVTPFGEVFQKFDKCRIEIHSINLETYNLLIQVQAQTTNSGLFATTPENIKCNISTNSKTKVAGWFCMSSVSFREKIAQ